MVSFRNFQRIHMVGIGGIGMSGIAEVLAHAGLFGFRVGHQAIDDYGTAAGSGCDGA
jgi:UDP-N-acetylmuramate-alanine ligase